MVGICPDAAPVVYLSLNSRKLPAVALIFLFPFAFILSLSLLSRKKDGKDLMEDVKGSGKATGERES